MIFVRDKGRMCNNILQFGHVYAWAREHNRSCMSMRFAYKYQYFHICHTRWHNFLTYAVAKYAAKMGMLPVAGFHNVGDNPEAQQLLENHHNIVVEGWEVRYYDLFLKYKQEIINLFAFNPNIINKVKGMMGKTDTMKLGLHIRRGDYKTWHGGRYWYSDTQYAEVVRRFANSHSGKPVELYVCGNDPNLDSIRSVVDPNIRVIIPHGNPAEDLCMLSECDYIIGAPSTFSLVASMYHNRPLAWIMSADEELKFDTFDNLFKRII